MIFAVMILSVILFVLLNVFSKKLWHTILSVFFALVFLGSLALVTLNDHEHYGMKKVTETKTTSLVSSADSKAMNLLLYQPLGDGTEKVYLYKTDDAQKKPKPTGTDHVTNVVEKNQKKNEKKTEKTYWVYKNDQSKFWFSLSSKDHELIKEKNTFSVEKDWLVLSTDQAKELAEKVKNSKGQMETKGKAFVQAKVKEAMMKNPSLTPAEQQALVKQATAEFQQQAMEQIIADVTK